MNDMRLKIEILVIVTKYEKKYFRGERWKLIQRLAREQGSPLYRNHWFLDGDAKKRGFVNL